MDHESRPGSPTVRPAVLGRNSPPTFYRGAGRIDRFRGVTTDVSDRPEDWVASTVTVFPGLARTSSPTQALHGLLCLLRGKLPGLKQLHDHLNDLHQHIGVKLAVFARGETAE